jgi:hypothetical protein
LVPIPEDFEGLALAMMLSCQADNNKSQGLEIKSFCSSGQENQPRQKNDCIDARQHQRNGREAASVGGFVVIEEIRKVRRNLGNDVALYETLGLHGQFCIRHELNPWVLAFTKLYLRLSLTSTA